MSERLVSVADAPVVGEANLTVARLGPQDLRGLTTFCVTCSAFFELVRGKPGSRDVAEEILRLVPPGKSAECKHLFAFVGDGNIIVAIADMAEDYPEPHHWYLSLLLVSPTWRATGTGSIIWLAIEHWIRRRGGQAIRLIVQQQNPRARRFWEKQGFSLENEATQTFPEQENRVWVMHKPTLA